MNMMKNWKKTLIAAGVMAALLTGSAFAATEAEDAATQQQGLDYNNKIEQQAPDMEKGHPPFGFHKDGQHRHGPHHGPHHDGEFRGPHDGNGPMGGPCHHHGKFHDEKEDRPGKLTQEQRQQLAKEREQFFIQYLPHSQRLCFSNSLIIK